METGNYAKIKNNQLVFLGSIVGMYDRDSEGRTYTNIHFLSNDELRELFGYYPATIINPVYNPYTQATGNTLFEINEDTQTVTITTEIFDRSTEEINQTIEFYKNYILNNFYTLLDKTDWTQINDYNLTDAQKDQYNNFRSNIRVASENLDGLDVNLLVEIYDNTITPVNLNIYRNGQMPVELSNFNLYLDNTINNNNLS